MTTINDIASKPIDEQISFYKQNKGLYGGQSAYLDAPLKFLEDKSTSADDLPRFQQEFQKYFSKFTKKAQEDAQQLQKYINNDFTAFANKTDFSALDAGQAQQELEVLKSSPDTQQRLNSLQTWITDLKKYGLDASAYESQLSTLKSRLGLSAAQLAGTQFTPAGATRTESGFQINSELEPKAVPSVFTPTEYSNTSGLSALQTQVMGADPNAKANKDFINGVFKAFHNRDATAEELRAYEGKAVSMVRNEIVGGAQAAGLPTVAAGTQNLPTGILTPEEAKAKGYQKVLRPDQLSAFTENQIIRDNRGGIYLNPATTTKAQQTSVASGTSGTALSEIKYEPTTANSDAQVIDQAVSAPNPAFVVDPTDASYNPAQVIDTISSAVIGSTQKLVDALTAQISAIDQKQQQIESTIAGFSGRIEDLAFNETTEDKLNALLEKNQVQEKYDKLSTVLSQIEAEKQKLNLGLIQENNKLAPLSIIGRRQQALQEQALATIGTLSAIATIYQGDVNFAKDIVQMTMDAVNADRTTQLNTLEFLIGLEKDKIVELDQEEQNAVSARMTALQDSIANAQRNSELIVELITAHPEAAAKAKVSITDSPALAASKMAPYLAEEASEAAKAERTAIVDLGGRKALIDLSTGQEIKSFTETLAPGTEAPLTADQKMLQQFQADVADMIVSLDNGELSWQAARDALRVMYPDVPDDYLDGMLGGGQRPDGSLWGRAGDGSPFDPVAADTQQGVNAIIQLKTAFSVGSKGGQCGRFVNQHTNFRMGDSYASKMAFVDPKIVIPRPGDVFVMPYKGTGHTGFVDHSGPVQADGSFDVYVVDSNWGLDRKVQYHVINSKKLSGFARPQEYKNLTQ